MKGLSSSVLLTLTLCSVIANSDIEQSKYDKAEISVNNSRYKHEVKREVKVQLNEVNYGINTHGGRRTIRGDINNEPKPDGFENRFGIGLNKKCPAGYEQVGGWCVPRNY